MSQRYRLAGAGRVDRSSPLSFEFNGKQYQGYRGDTLSSALLANGVHLIGRSFKYHRPRGIMASGWEDPNAQVQLESGGHTLPNTQATVTELYPHLRATSQNCWPSVEHDVGAVNSALSRFFVAGFYYKTFKWPRKAWEPLYERVIRRAAGMGKAPAEEDPDRYEHQYAHCEVLVVGGGVAGLAAARAAADSGVRVMLLDEQNEYGGALLGSSGESIDGMDALDWVASTVAALRENPKVTLLTRTQASGYYDYNYLVATERVTDHVGPQPTADQPRQRLWKIRAQQVVLACGAIERPQVFADNDRPGILLASAIRHYQHRYGVLPGKALVVLTNNDSAYHTAIDAAAAGVHATVVDVRPAEDIGAADRARKAGVVVLENSAITGVDYRVKRGIRSVAVHRLSPDGESLVGGAMHIDCDLIGTSGGWSPTVHLHTQARGKLHWLDEHLCYVPAQLGGNSNPRRSAGGCNGALGLAEALAQGHAAGSDAARDCGATTASVSAPAAQSNDFTLGKIRPLWVLPCEHPVGMGKKKHFHEYQNDATVADVQLAHREGFSSIEHLKRYTNTGRGTDQGKLTNVNGIALMAQARRQNVPDVGFTTFRPPYTPLAFGAVIGQNTHDTFIPARPTAMHPWHVEHGAVFEDVGDWKRPWYFPHSGESMHDAVQRECKAVRASVGVLDASTLGKIDISGPDAVRLLEMVYTNAWQKLAIGQCRYGVMCNEHGMVFDDGVTTRLGEQHFHMTTTSGGAARVLEWLEEWLQTEWPDWQVFCTSVTEQWAVVSLNGPRARDVLAKLTDIDLDEESFGFMRMREGQVAGVEARIFRISFTGDLAYEINVPARYGRYVWEQVMEAGAEFDITPYGTEAMHVLRAERGFIITGQDTDGTVTPMDLDMDWIVSKKKPDCLGKRSWTRSDTAREGRKQLVGLLTQDPEEVLPEGAHIVSKVLPKPPMEMLGHVTSSYYSPNAVHNGSTGRSIAMALLKDGFARLGDTVDLALIDGRHVRAKVVKPNFLEEAGDA